MNHPASPNLLSEVAIGARMAHAALGSSKVDWLAHANDYALIRDGIEKVIDGFHDYNERLKHPGGFHLWRRATACGRRRAAARSSSFTRSSIRRSTAPARCTASV